MTTFPRARWAARLGVAALAAVALTGCIKMDMDLTLDGDTASGSVIVAVEKEFLDMAGAEPEDVLSDLNAEADLPDDTTAEPYEDDTYVGQRFEFDGAPLSDFNDEDLSITYDPDAGEHEFTGAMDMTDAGDTGDMPAGMAEAMMESFDMAISITFPGEVTEHNGELSGNTVTWRPAVGEANEMRALASEGGASGGLPVWLIAALAGLVVVVVAGLVAFFALRSRGRPGPGPTDGEQPDTA